MTTVPDPSAVRRAAEFLRNMRQDPGSHVDVALSVIDAWLAGVPLPPEPKADHCVHHPAHGVNSERAAYLVARCTVNPITRCWMWNQGVSSWGYGNACHQGYVEKAHRMAFETWVGEIPSGMGVLHHCDNPRCINPCHLFLGTQGENTAERDRKNRQRAPLGSSNGNSKLTEEQVAAIKGSGRAVSDWAGLLGLNPETIRRARSNGWKAVEPLSPDASEDLFQAVSQGSI